MFKLLLKLILFLIFRESGASSGQVLTPEQRDDPTFILEKWVLLYAHQLRRWRLGMVIARLPSGYIGMYVRLCVSVCTCICMRVCVCVCVLVPIL